MGIDREPQESRVILEAPAKINVHLKVTGRRSNGYHELISVMIPLSLVDRVEIRTMPEEGIELAHTGGAVVEGEQNLVWQAARAFLSKAGIRRGLSIRLHKRIPVAAGLGGGSSDAAATLLALDRIWPGFIDEQALFRMAVGLGADVPFFLSPGPTLATGIGDVLERLDYWPDLWYVLIKPPEEVSTAWVYEQLEMRLTTRENNYIFKILEQDTFSVAELLENDLEHVTESRFPVVKKLKETLLEAGAVGALMTGSGPTVFGVFHAAAEAEAAARKIIPRELGDVFVAANWAGQRRAH